SSCRASSTEFSPSRARCSTSAEKTQSSRAWCANTTAASPWNRATRTDWRLPSARWHPIANARAPWASGAARCTSSASRRRSPSRRGRTFSMRKVAGIASALLAIAYVAFGPEPSRGPLPPDVDGMAERLAEHPADWLAASALTERALDTPVREPLALWHAAGALAISLAPSFPQPRASFARAPLFHWNDSRAADRKLVLDAYAPVLRDWDIFVKVYESIFALTGDFGYLRRAQPEGEESTQELAELAATNGLFDDYRSVRATLPNGLRTRRRIETDVVDARRSIGITITPQHHHE